MPKTGQTVGGYELRGPRPIGSGANAEVWVAARPDAPPIALKILKKTDGESERYLRFKREVAEHTRLSDIGVRGVLPLLDYELPDQPGKGHPAWLAMPIATPLTEALGETPVLEDVVAAVADIAETLAELHGADPPVAHRDVKPNNCYRYKNAWVISDFGLVETPGSTPLTVGGKALGPRNFIAPEMVAKPDVADGPPADVYSLGKTLWSLVTGNPNPPSGEHRPEWAWKNLSEFGVSHPRAFYLDSLIGHMTREVPEERVPMAAVARTLQEWCAAPRVTSRSELAIGDLAATVADAQARGKQPLQVRATRLATADRIAMNMAAQAAAILQGLDAAGVNHSGFVSDATFSVDVLQKVAAQLPGRDMVAGYRTCKIEHLVGSNPAVLCSGVGVALSINNQVALAAAHSLSAGGQRKELWADTAVVVLDSQEQERQAARLADALLRNFQPALAALADAVTESG